jgi:hypothetical protein
MKDDVRLNSRMMQLALGGVSTSNYEPLIREMPVIA